MLMKLRTSVTSLAAAALCTGLALAGAPAVAQELTVVSFGGAYQEGQSKALFTPAAKAMNVKVKEETYTGIAALRLKVKAGSVTWDVVASGSGSAARAGAEGILEKLDYKVIDISSFAPGLATRERGARPGRCTRSTRGSAISTSLEAGRARVASSWVLRTPTARHSSVALPCRVRRTGAPRRMRTDTRPAVHTVAGTSSGSKPSALHCSSSSLAQLQRPSVSGRALQPPAASADGATITHEAAPAAGPEMSTGTAGVWAVSSAVTSSSEGIRRLLPRTSRLRFHQDTTASRVRLPD